MGYLRILGRQASLQMTKVVNFEQASFLNHISYPAKVEVTCTYRDSIDV